MTCGSSLWPWLLQRISGLFLSAGVIIHFWMLHKGGGPPVYEQVVARLISPCWVSFYFLLLAALLYHGLNGAWAIFLDFNTSPSAKYIFKVTLYLIGFCTFTAGVIVLTGFTP
jgi:succinate dehydrogenase hydrophobic anchor subunit